MSASQSTKDDYTVAWIRPLDIELEIAPTLAVEQMSPEVALVLLKHGADVGASDAWGCIPLILAARTWHAETAIVRLLLDAGARINATARDGRTSLAWAALYECPGIVEILLSNGADIDIEDSNG